MSTSVVKLAYQNDAVAQDYDRERFANFAGWLFDRLEKRTIRRVVCKAAGQFQQPRVLDAPCGTGRITELLLQCGLRTVGGDISNEMIDVASRKLSRFGDQIAFQRLDLDQLDVPENSFDIVTCIRLFHHLESKDRAAVLANLARATQRYVIINVSYSSWYYRLRRGIKRMLGQGISRTSSTWQEICKETEQAGLKIRSMHFVLPGISEDAIILLEKVND